MLRRVVPIALVIALLLAAGLAYAAWTVRQGDDGEAHYLALGDSLAVGVQPGDEGADGGYVAIVHRELRKEIPSLRLTNLACSGETTESFLSGRCSYDGAETQVDAAVQFLREHRDSTRLITIDIGANDVTPCAGSGSVDAECARTTFAEVRGNLHRILKPLREAAGEDVPIVAMNYYDPFLAAALLGPEGQRLASQSVRYAQEFNNQLETVYALYDVKVADVEKAFQTTVIAPVTRRGGGNRPTNVVRICEWTWMCSQRDIHANDEGYAVIARTFLSVIEDSGVVRAEGRHDGVSHSAAASRRSCGTTCGPSNSR